MVRNKKANAKFENTRARDRARVAAYAGPKKKKTPNALGLVPIMKMMSMAGRTKKPRNPRVQRNIGTLGLSAGALKYATAILNPWSPDADGAYIPIGNGRGTQKAKSFARFDMTIGSAGVGWVLVAPTVANDVVSVWYTTSTYAGTSAVPYTSTAIPTLRTGVSGITQNCPYSSVNLLAPYVDGSVKSTGVYGRVVSASMSAQYIGLAVDQGGLLYCFTDPDHETVTESDTASLGSRSETDVTNISRDRCTIVDFPLQEQEAVFDRDTAFQAANDLTALANTNSRIVPLFPFSSGLFPGPAIVPGIFPQTFYSGAPTMVILATGKPGNQIHMELVQHLEYQGVVAEGKLTPTPVDRLGFEKVLSSASLALSSKMSYGSVEFPKLFVKALKEVNSSLKPTSAAKVLSSIGA